jgi:hypothetical protein
VSGITGQLVKTILVDSAVTVMQLVIIITVRTTFPIVATKLMNAPWEHTTVTHTPTVLIKSHVDTITYDSNVRVNLDTQEVEPTVAISTNVPTVDSLMDVMQTPSVLTLLVTIIHAHVPQDIEGMATQMGPVVWILTSV